MTWRTETLSQIAKDIVNIALTSLKEWLALKDPSLPKYPEVWNLANEIQGTLDLNVSVTKQDIIDASAIISYYYPDFADQTTLATELNRALSSRMTFKTTSKAKFLIVPLVIILLLFMPKKKIKKNLEGDIMTCGGFYRTQDKTGKTIHRCFFYEPSCPKPGSVCRSEKAPLPKPEAEKKLYEPSKNEVLGMAEELAYQHNEELDGARELMRKILAYGGIAPYRGGYLTEEYKDLPTKYKRKSGIPIDEIAQELGFREESSLVAAIEDAESTFQRMKSMQGRGKIRKFKTDDFLDMAWDRLVKEHQYRFSGSAYMGYIRNSKHKKGELGAYRKKIYGEEFFSPRQKELFQVLRRELIMKPEDIAKSADLIEACLERQGWEIKRVKQIQESISAKMTPDMFGKMQKLTGPEVMLQESIQRCLDMMRV